MSDKLFNYVRIGPNTTPNEGAQLTYGEGSNKSQILEDVSIFLEHLKLEMI